MNEELIPKIMSDFQRFGIINHTYPNAIGMWQNEQECLLWGVLNSSIEANWLEIGSFHGGSAVLMCLARKLLCDKPSVISVDRDFSPMFDKNIGFGNLQYLSKKIQIESLNLGEVYNDGPISFALIDGWHSFKGALIDFENVNRHLINGGFIAFHDVDLFENDAQIEEYYKKALKNYDYFMSEPLPNNDIDAQSFHLEELSAFIIKEKGFKLIKPPVFNGIRRPSDSWKPGTPETNSLILLQKE